MILRAILICLAVAAQADPAGTRGSGELGRAIAECDREISERPGDAGAWRRRGELNFRMARIAQSVADFDREVALRPEIDPYHWQRGISYYYAGEFDRGRAQFERHRAVNPDDVENAAWHFFCVARGRGIAEARKALIVIDVAKDARIPMAEIYRLLRGDGTEDAPLVAAGRAVAPGRRQAFQYAHLYLGLWHEVNGDPVRSLAHIRLSADEYGMGHYMGAVARTHLMLRESTRR